MKKEPPRKIYDAMAMSPTRWCGSPYAAKSLKKKLNSRRRKEKVASDLNKEL